MKNPESKTINGNQWEVSPWTGLHAVRMQATLTKTASPFIKSLREIDSLEDIKDGEAAGAIAELLASLEADQVVQLVKSMLVGVSINGKDASMDAMLNTHFAGNTFELYQGLWFVLQVNFADFTALVGSITSLVGVPTRKADKAKGTRKG